MEISWNLAARDAVAGGFDEIRPEHVCMALLKVAEIPTGELAKIVPKSADSADAAHEVQSLRKVLEEREIDTTYVRRVLRMLLGKGHQTYNDGVVHRSKECRQLFEAATQVARGMGEARVRTHDLLGVLLSAPPPDIARLLRNLPKPARPSWAAQLPLLARYGVEVTGRPALEEGDGSREPTPGCRSLMAALREKVSGTVFLVTEDDRFARQIVREAAGKLTFNPGRCEESHVLIFDVTGAVTDTNRDDGPPEFTVRDLFDEASRAPGVALLVPPLGNEPTTPEGQCWTDEVRQASLSGRPTLICRINPSAYEHHVAKDRTWRERSRAMGLHDTSRMEIPGEL